VPQLDKDPHHSLTLAFLAVKLPDRSGGEQGFRYPAVGFAPVTSAGMLRDFRKDIGHDNVSASLPAKSGLRARPSWSPGLRTEVTEGSVPRVLSGVNRMYNVQLIRDLH
jgi:hypothetical protein